MRILPIIAAAMAASLTLQAAPPAFADDSSPQTVEQLAEKAFQQHAAGKYADSIATYLKAYELSKASDILFNVATIYDRKLHERELAMEFYRRYLGQPDASPDVVKRATERLTVLKKEAEEARKAAPPVVVAPPPPAASPSPPPPPPMVERPDPGWRTAGIIVGATGIAGVLASLSLGAAAKSKNDAANGVCGGSSCASQQGVTDAHDAGNLATYSTVAMIAGGTLFAAGILFFVAAPRTSAPATGVRWTLSPQAGAHGGGLSLGAGF